MASIGTAGASSNWTSGGYAYDGTGNVKAVGSLHSVYDTVSRLTSADAASGKTQTASFDAFGNITQTTTTDSGLQSFSYSASTNRLNNPVTYDAGGHLTTWSPYAYAYNDLGQPLTVTGTGVNQTFLYDAFGERVAVRDAQHTLTTLALRGLDGELLRTYVESGTSGSGATTWQQDWVWANGTLLATVSADPDAGTRYTTVDHFGTPRLVTDACASCVAQHTYYAFGLEVQPVAQDGERIRFTGQETDQQGTSGQTDDLVNMHARAYNPNIARFLATDPLRGDPYHPQTFNLFAYVGGNPSTLLDPFGFTSRAPCPADGTGDCFGDAITVTPNSNWILLFRFFFGSPGITGDPDNGGGATTVSERLRQTVCSILPSGRTTGFSASYGGVGPTIYGAEVVLNYNTGQVSLFGFGGAGTPAWNGGVQFTAYSGYILGPLRDSNSNYAGGFTGGFLSANLGQLGAGVFGAFSSAGLAGLARGQSVWDALRPASDGAVVLGTSVSWSAVPSPTGGAMATNYTSPSQLGNTWGVTGIDQTIFFARQLLCQ